MSDGMTCTAASVAYASVVPRIVEPGVLALEVPAVRDKPVQFELLFTGTTRKPATRQFSAGLVG
jgi:hypothetical protein